MSGERRYTFVADRDGVALVHDGIPAPVATEVLLRVRYSLVSPGTERHYIRDLAGSDGSLALGYCVVGTVLACGAQVHHVAPGDCAIAMGWTIATHSSHVVVPTKLVARVPEGLSLTYAVLAPLTATAVHAADRARLAADDKVLVVGLGPIGTLQAMVAAATGCAVWAWDLDPVALESETFWRPLDPSDPPGTTRGAITAVFLCIDADVTELLKKLIALLAADGTGQQRSRIVNVGRLSGTLMLEPATGNIDIINASRCGAGYRNDVFHHGRTAVAAVPGEHTVDENLRQSLVIVAAQAARLGRLPLHVHTPAQALEHYNRAAFFPSGFHLIDHGSR
jgi:hypothetical protein